MLRATRSSATRPFAVVVSTFSAAATAASAAAARTSVSACVSAWAILASAIFVRRAMNSSTLTFASAASCSASALALATIASASPSASRRRRSDWASTAWASSRNRRASSSSDLMRAPRLSRALTADRCTPNFASTAKNSTKAIATQVSASYSMSRLSAFEHVVDSVGDRRFRWRDASQPSNDRTGGIERNAAHVLQCSRLGGGDRFLRLSQLGVEVILQHLAGPLGLRIELVTGFARNQLRACARLRQRLFVGRHRGAGLVLETIRRGEIGRNAAPSYVDDAANARQSVFGDEHIKGDKGDRKPEQLRAQGVPLKRRKMPVTTGGHFGMCAGFLGHQLLQRPSDFPGLRGRTAAAMRSAAKRCQAL